MKIDTVVTTWIGCDPATTFEGASNTEDLPKIFPGKGPIPGVVSAQVLGGGPLQQGATRRVKTKDGNELDETYIQFNRPNDYGYEMTKLKPPLSLLVTKATGVWKFTPEKDGTRIVWTYSCDLTTFLVAPVAALLVKVFIKGAMQDCLTQVKTGIDSKKSS